MRPYLYLRFNEGAGGKSGGNFRSTSTDRLWGDSEYSLSTVGAWALVWASASTMRKRERERLVSCVDFTRCVVVTNNHTGCRLYFLLGLPRYFC